MYINGGRFHGCTANIGNCGNRQFHREMILMESSHIDKHVYGSHQSRCDDTGKK